MLKLQDNPGCGDCACNRTKGVQTNESCCTCIQNCRCTCSSRHGLVSHCCPCSCPCHLGLIEDTGIQVCNPCGCLHGVCQNETRDGLKCCKCFPGTARVTLERGESITMSELKIGDRVQTGRETSRLLSNGWMFITSLKMEYIIPCNQNVSFDYIK